MLNSTLFGGDEARAALAKASLKLEVDTNWCVGGCKHWKKTSDGRARYAGLTRINQERKNKGLSHVEA